MRKIFTTICALIFILSTISARQHETGNKQSHNIAVTIHDIALIGISGPAGYGSTINLTPDISNLEAGEKVNFSSANDNSLWLNYTSIIGNRGNGNGNAHGKARKIKVELEDNLPNGMDLFLEVGPANSGSGQTGAAKQEKTALKKGPATVVENIGSCYTENGEGKGHRLTYSLGVKENQLDKVMAESFSVQVIYTITEN
jgi:hypothetical protein